MNAPKSSTVKSSKIWGDFWGESGTWSRQSFGWLSPWQLWASVTSSHNNGLCGAASRRVRYPSHLQRDRDVFVWSLIPESTWRHLGNLKRGEACSSVLGSLHKGMNGGFLWHQTERRGRWEMTLASLCFEMQMGWGEVPCYSDSSRAFPPWAGPIGAGACSWDSQTLPQGKRQVQSPHKQVRETERGNGTQRHQKRPTRAN